MGKLLANFRFIAFACALRPPPISYESRFKTKSRSSHFASGKPTVHLHRAGIKSGGDSADGRNLLCEQAQHRECGFEFDSFVLLEWRNSGVFIMNTVEGKELASDDGPYHKMKTSLPQADRGIAKGKKLQTASIIGTSSVPDRSHWKTRLLSVRSTTRYSICKTYFPLLGSSEERVHQSGKRPTIPPKLRMQHYPRFSEFSCCGRREVEAEYFYTEYGRVSPDRNILTHSFVITS